MANTGTSDQGKPARLNRGTAKASHPARMPDTSSRPSQGIQNPPRGDGAATFPKPYGPGHASRGRRGFPKLPTP